MEADESVACPRCRTTRYRNPSLQLLINVCGHSLCESCVDQLFARGSGACPECNTALRRHNFHLQFFEDAVVQKEVNIRRDVLKDFNMKENDFDSLMDYNNYLEMVEDIIFNLANNIDIAETKQKIEQYKMKNKEKISKNKIRHSENDEELDYIIATEKEKKEAQRKMMESSEKEEKMSKQRQKDELIDKLMESVLPANKILEQHMAKVEKINAAQKSRAVFSTGIHVGQSSSQAHVPIVKDDEAYHYESSTMSTDGPDPPDSQTLADEGFVEHVKSLDPANLGGGYTNVFACQRALEESFAGLYFDGI